MFRLGSGNSKLDSTSGLRRAGRLFFNKFTKTGWSGEAVTQFGLLINPLTVARRPAPRVFFSFFLPVEEANKFYPRG